MGAVSQFFQPPEHWQDFESLVEGMLREVYDITNAQQVGSPGQSQNGVDVFGYSRRYGHIGVQCKRLTDLDRNGQPRPGGLISQKMFRDEAANALGFFQTLDLWVLATTAKRDTRMQKMVAELNKDRRQPKCGPQTMIWSWNECVGALNLHPHLQRTYYDEVIRLQGADELDRMILEMIATAFHRPAFEMELSCESPSDFLRALSDTQKAIRTGELVDRESRHIIRRAVGGWREISNPQWREALREIDDMLRNLRWGLMKGIRDQAINHRGALLEISDANLAHRLEGLRSAAVRALRKILQEASVTSP